MLPTVARAVVRAARAQGQRAACHIRHIGAQTRTKCWVEAVWSSAIASATWASQAVTGQRLRPTRSSFGLMTAEGAAVEPPAQMEVPENWHFHTCKS
jgi:hypothetical protein